MRLIVNGLLGILLGLVAAGGVLAAEDRPKVVVLAFELNDLTGLPNAPEELQRIELLSTTFKQELKAQGVNMVPEGERVRAEIERNSPTYLYDNVETAIELNKETGADYLIIGVALKPTYLFVYPRIIMVDVGKRAVVMSRYMQLESSWSDQQTTIRTAEKLAQLVKARLDKLGTAAP
ncbi:DUF2380 domain-containing protein [Methylobacillus sp.]|uniref:DUF2380 domain-containing protein n=1 Tax=Methylobacillus sp. TaxID=56818 RepID=UPI00257F7136|nr:DUF2380 domain-containing protein [Methylobacillus sp.]